MKKSFAIIPLLLFLFSLCIIPSVFALQKSIPLLALTEIGNETSGTVAELTLETQAGSERVFLETYPLTKTTTQASLRFAQQIACNELELDCSEIDFLFTIKALPGIVGGPSAGAAASILSAAVLENLELRKDTALTGTINSGGLIGSVGGLKEKIGAGASAGFRYVLIPKGNREFKEEDNTTTDLVEFGKKINVTVVEAGTFDETLNWFTGKKTNQENTDFAVEPKYEEAMRKIATTICNRGKETREQISTEFQDEEIINRTAEAKNLTERAKETFDRKEYYTAASYCFRANVGLREALLRTQNYTLENVKESVARLNKEAGDLQKKIDGAKIASLTDLQTYMAADERLFEVNQALSEVSKEAGNLSNETLLPILVDSLAYVEERLYSALAWSYFFSIEDASKAFVLDDNTLRESCANKISEAEERYNYIDSFILLQIDRDALDNAYAELGKKRYVSCIFRASRAKADLDVVLNSMGVDESALGTLVDLKLEIAKQAIAKSLRKGVFPIIGYSYYEYAKSLTETDNSSAFLFSEYALEFSGLDVYFEKNTKKPAAQGKTFADTKTIGAFLLGIAAGMLVLLGILRFGVKRKRTARRTRRR